jgi:hypothetical protein
MRVNTEHDGDFIPPEILESAVSIITSCLNNIKTTEDAFIVNDLVHFRRQRTRRVTPCVMNSATYISRKFQSNLSEIDGCQGETKIIGQDIDGLMIFQYIGHGYKIRDKDKLLEVLHSYIASEDLPSDSIFRLFPMFYGMYVQSDFYDISHLPLETHTLFDQVEVNREFTLGVEFETGNVASSFRALNKLFVLFQSRYIDAGVFVTSIDKASSATRIWPVSNRNGSFQELRQRDFMRQISLPLICIGFAPDSFDREADFLGKDGSLYQLESTGIYEDSYEILLGEDGEEILKPII